MKKKASIFILLLVMSYSLFAMDNLISLDEAISMAYENNTDMEVARYDLGIALRDANMASSYIPDITISGSVIDRTFGTGVDASVGISMDLGTDLIMDSAEKSIQKTLAYLTYASTEQSLEESITTSYLALSRSKKEIESASNNLESARRSYEMLKEAYDGGLASSLDMAEADSDDDAYNDFRTYPYGVLPWRRCGDDAADCADVVGGILTGAFLTLLLSPVLYSLLNTRREKKYDDPESLTNQLLEYDRRKLRHLDDQL